MRKILAFLVTIGLVSMSASDRAAAPQSPAGKPAPTVDDILKEVRVDLQASKADLMAKNLTLTSEQAAKFWPVFEQYQKEQNVIMDEQLKGVQSYADNYESLDDATALGLMSAHLDRDTRMTALRQKWLGEFQKVLPTKLAVRAMQIDRRLSLVQQIQIAARIPLVY
jgi:Spy/CpxP family protein refolding chaperone